MRVVSNGKPLDVPDGATVDELLHQLGLGAKWVLVERNGEPVMRSAVATTVLEPGDRLELIRAVAGG
ncbi:MAG: sulfur carrier protein [Actinomycetota bacterium]|nr:sulfur carrier protein [Actinomycetota bacterium]